VQVRLEFLGLPGWYASRLCTSAPRTSTAYSIKGTGAPEELSRQKILDKERVLPYLKTF
jgi:hypothetical protein